MVNVDLERALSRLVFFHPFLRCFFLLRKLEQLCELMQSFNSSSRKAGVGALTDSDASVLGTATSSCGADDVPPALCVASGPGAHDAKAQKFIVLTSMRCNSHGRGRVSGASSRGNFLLRAASSEGFNCQTANLWSRPCLGICQQRPIFELKHRSVQSREGETTHVITRSSPHPCISRIAFSWARQTAMGLMMVRSQTTTKPCASPLTSRSLLRMKVKA